MSTLIVKDIMTSPVETIPMDESVEAIKEIFDNSHYHHLVVLGDGGKCAGVISDRDLLKNLSPFIGKLGERTSDLNCLKRRAHQIMTRQLVAVRANTSLRAATRVMLDHRISCLPVVDRDKKCIGIITIRDVVQWAMNELEKESTTAVQQDASDKRAA
ncbi:MAG: CBS domain-containing protein [Phycisphaerales bacterium JB052]